MTGERCESTEETEDGTSTKGLSALMAIHIFYILILTAELYS